MTAITLDAAQRALAAGIAEAERRGVAVSVAVVDAGGVLRAFARMDGAEIAGEVLAVDKAYTAVAHRTSTAELGALAQPGGELFGLQGNGQRSLCHVRRWIAGDRHPRQRDRRDRR